MFTIASILFVIIASCSGETPEYLKGGVTNVTTAGGDALPQVSVSFEPGSLPAAIATVNSINVFVTSPNGATKYRSALLSGPAAEQGATACAEATYSEFFPLADLIKASDLPEGSQLLCARGKNAAGIVQEAATTHAWKVESSLDGGEEPPPTAEPSADDLSITVVVNVPPSTSTPVTVTVPTQPQPQPTTQPTTQPMPPAEPTPDPMAKMQVKKNNNSGTLSHAFTHGQKDSIPYYVHNTGNAALTWSLKLDAQDAGWLRVKYNGETKIGSAISFSGALTANSTSSPIELSLALDDGNRVDSKYLAVKKVNGKRVETSEYMAKLTFKNENTGVSESAHVSVYLWIPRIGLKKDSPARKHQWELPIQNEDYDRKTMYIEKRGKGNLYWSNIKTDYNKFRVNASNQANGGYFYVTLRKKGEDDNDPTSVGDHTHMGIISNSGSTYVGQPDSSVRWLMVCVVNGNVNANTECPEHDSGHHN